MGTSCLHEGRSGPSRHPLLACREGREGGDGSWAPKGAPIMGSVPCGKGMGSYGPLARTRYGKSSFEQIGKSHDRIQPGCRAGVTVRRASWVQSE